MCSITCGWQLDQNLFAPGSISAVLNQPPLRSPAGGLRLQREGIRRGITVDRFCDGGPAAHDEVFGRDAGRATPAARAQSQHYVRHRVALPIPPMAAARMGRVGSRFYELGQWYPRMAVYDDVHGWNTLPFLGAGEFYLEFGDFDISLTVPAGFQVAATGALANPTAIRTPQGARSAGGCIHVSGTSRAGHHAAGSDRQRRASPVPAHGRGASPRATSAISPGPRGSGLRWDASTWTGS